MGRITVFSDKHAYEKYQILFDIDALEAALVSCIDKSALPQQINIVLVGNRKIRELNRVFRSIDEATDVLSFDYRESFEAEPKSKYNTGAGNAGEVYVSIPYLRKITAMRPDTFERVLKETAVHGLLHLAGYDHQNRSDENTMNRFQQLIVEKVM